MSQFKPPPHVMSCQACPQYASQICPLLSVPLSSTFLYLPSLRPLQQPLNWYFCLWSCSLLSSIAVTTCLPCFQKTPQNFSSSQLPMNEVQHLTLTVPYLYFPTSTWVFGCVVASAEENLQGILMLNLGSFHL